jgi:hypothetical protein
LVQQFGKEVGKFVGSHFLDSCNDVWIVSFPFVGEIGSCLERFYPCFSGLFYSPFRICLAIQEYSHSNGTKNVFFARSGSSGALGPRSVNHLRDYQFFFL